VGWSVAQGSALLALVASLLAALLFIFAPLAEPVPWIAAAPLNLLVSALISLIGFTVVRYSVAYLAGDPAEQRYRVWLQLCLASVSLVVVSDHLLLLVLAWSAISICLHQLLMCYPERFRAVLAAHKKFIFARLGEACLLAAAFLLWQQHGTLRISDILAEYPTDLPLTLTQQGAAVLLALAALIKCAQLPMHGWLMQVVEAPTPVSALLHAGIINLGGYLMILMAPLMMQSEPARWLLLLVAGVTALLAALIMMARISIKVKLAWSTSAQMGLMLVQCALGLHELALLHLLGHSCYKAYSFLASGSAVLTHLDRQLTGHQPVNITLWLRNLLLSIALIGTLLWLLADIISPAQWSILTLLTVAISLWLPTHGKAQHLLRSLALAAVLLGAYLAQKTVLTSLLPSSADAGWPAALWVMLLSLLLLMGYGLLVMRPTALAYRWRQWLFAGLYLDEWVTRTTLKLWPVNLPATAARKLEQPAIFTEGAV
jgi:NAD(P)H-quinone oxidoreductase subunit 5